MSYIRCSSHLDHMLNPEKRQETLDNIVRKLYTIWDEFDALAVCGNSGVLPAAYIASSLQKNIILVRKPDDSCYSSYLVEGPQDGRYFILDDLVCTGNTVRHIVNSIYENHCEYALCVGAYFYHDDLLWSSDDVKRLMTRE